MKTMIFHSKWSKKDEEQAKKEYDSMISLFKESDEIGNEWRGHWDSIEKKLFNGKTVVVKGDKDKYMKYWIDNQSIINDTDWDKIDSSDEYF